MPISRVVINASPLITLFGSNQHHILPELFDEIIIPDAVWQEIVEGGHQDIAAASIPTTPWLIKKKLIPCMVSYY